ncbi:bifunctional methyltransferase/pyrophosphohydrolase YabN [Anaeromicrobium sediminis]|uniref:Nucleoside triphosphate pyrophosphohydrolase n=1 Tax=Anaeromicrobium sediminis TaxID=1478221 RepID=A0A267MDK5_9FIRM|nr:nucleoside triphosphate pyrophosphohydrolase [Anaeromicrobium sediminis]PAB57636.1 nucleoside triphosphate pyrophosphohydrolase [Anaeromicrobium sediminis]
MNKLTVVGLGPGSKNYLTIGALDKLKESKKVYLRTKKHPVVKYLDEIGIKYETFDHIYEETEDFNRVYESIVDTILNLLKEDEITYAVPGSPFVAESTVTLLDEKGIDIDYIESSSFIEAMLYVLKKDPVEGLTIVDALRLDYQIPNTRTNVIVTQVYDKITASNVKLKMMEYYNDDHEIIVIRGAGIEGIEKIHHVKLYEMDHLDDYDYLTSIYVPKIENNIKNPRNISDLVDIMKLLRSEDGCPWDREQSHESLKPYVIEEAYEVVEAIEEKDSMLLEEELGDLLLQVVFHAQIARENYEFTLNDIIKGISEKLVSRHPHVFKDLNLQNSDEVITTWEEIKREEKKEESYTEGLKRIPKSLPALIKSYKVQKKAAGVGFDWDKVEDAIGKVHEELGELLEIYKSQKKERIEEELGDLIFAVVNVARFLKVDPEIALNRTTKKFIERFAFIEECAKIQEKDLKDMSLQEMDKLWDEAKKSEKHT